MPLKLVNWNVRCATPGSWKRAPEIRRRIEQHAPEVICLTEAHPKLVDSEAHPELWTQEGYTICSQPYDGGDIRKVLLWSKEPWKEVDCVGSNSLLPGRFVSGVTQTSVGKVTVIGICIPFRGSRAEARRGSERKKSWEDHKQYLAGLTHVLERTPAKRLIVVGDFNQRIGQVRYAPPPDVRAALRSAMPPHMTIVTSKVGFQGRSCIDHIALSEDLAAESLGVISNMDGGTKLSDHFGVVAEVFAQNPR